MTGKQKPDKERAEAARRDRLGAALRENLKRRKDQARVRRDGDAAPADDGAGPDPAGRR